MVEPLIHFVWGKVGVNESAYVVLGRPLPPAQAPPRGLLLLFYLGCCFFLHGGDGVGGVCARDDGTERIRDGCRLPALRRM